MNVFNNFVNRKIRISNFEIGLVKIAVACFSIAIGSYFADVFRPYLLLLVLAGIAMSLWATVVWLKAMEETP
jgi:hypothetical protein